MGSVPFVPGGGAGTTTTDTGPVVSSGGGSVPFVPGGQPSSGTPQKGGLFHTIIGGAEKGVEGGLGVLENTIFGPAAPAVHQIPGLFGELQRFNKDVTTMGFESIPGTYHLVGMGIHDPVGTGREFLKQTLHSLTPEQLWLHPGYGLSSAWLGYGAATGALGRAGALAGIAARRGALAGSLVDELAAARAANPELGTNLEAAQYLGRGHQYSRGMRLGEGAEELGPRGVPTQMLQTLVRGLPPRERILTTAAGDRVHGWSFSKNPGVQALQMLVDRSYQRFPDEAPLLTRPLRLGFRTQAARIRAASMAHAQVLTKEATAQGALFAKKWAKIDSVKGMVARLVLEGVLPKDLIKFHQDQIAEGKLAPRDLAATQARVPIIEEAAKLLTTKTHKLLDSGGNVVGREKVPVLKKGNDELQQFIDDARALSNKRTFASRLAGVLDEESHYKRTVAPRNYIKYRQIIEDTGKLRQQIAAHERLGNEAKVKELRQRLASMEGQMALPLGGAKTAGEYGAPLVGDLAKQLTEAADLAYVPYKFVKPLGPESYGTAAFRKAIRLTRPKPPPEFTHPFLGDVLKAGGGNPNVVTLLGHSYTEAARFLSFKANYDHIIKSGRLTPEGIPVGNRVLVKVLPQNRFIPTLKGATERAMQPLAEGASPEDLAAAITQYAHVQKEYFPNPAEALTDYFKKKLTDHEQVKEIVDRFLHGTDPNDFSPVKGYVWVDNRILGGLDKTNPLAVGFSEHRNVRLIMQAFDMVNNAEKFAVLYLKPSYAIPNLLGNVALNLVQQGFLAPVNISKAFFRYLWLDPGDRALILHGMEGGLTESLKGRGPNVVSRVTQAGSRFYGSFVDTPFRFASFLHEAGEAGYTSSAELHRLLTDDAFSTQRQYIFNRANDEIINYERLGAGEQAILRRLIFFYPWIKGSTRYFTQFIKNHPVAAGIQGTAGQIGDEWVRRELGDLPHYLEGIIPYSHRYGSGTASIVQPASFSILGTPASLLESAGQLFSSHPIQGLSPLSELAPSYAGLLALASFGKNTTLAHPSAESPFVTAFHEMFGGQPIARLYKTLTGQPQPPSSVYGQESPLSGLMRFFLLSGLQPRPLDINMANYKAWKEQNPPRFTGG